MATYKKAVLISVFGLGILYVDRWESEESLFLTKTSTCVISVLRISVLSSMEIAAITFTIPRANVFNGIEPCLAVILASVPMTRLLLGRSAATPNQSSERPVKVVSKVKTPKMTDNEFERLDDYNGNLQLRPM